MGKGSQNKESKKMAQEDNLTKTGRVRREKTINMRKLRRERVHMPKEVIQWLDAQRPRRRSECRGGQRPCPHVACKYHLYLDVNPDTGSIKFNFPDKEVWELGESCALDVAERGGVTLEEVGFYMNLTRERIRQVEFNGMRKIVEEIETSNTELLPGDR